MTLRLLPVLALVLALGGCSAVSAVSGASAPLDAYTLAPAQGVTARATGRHLVVQTPAASGALATDRILIKPNRLQAAYLPKGRWVDPAPVLVQSLVVASLQNSGGFRLVGRDDAGLLPDFTLLIDLSAFQAEAVANAASPWLVRVALTVTLVRESDRRIAASRRFEQTVAAPDDTTLTLVNAFDAATSQVLRDVVGWTVSQAR